MSAEQLSFLPSIDEKEANTSIKNLEKFARWTGRSNTALMMSKDHKGQVSPLKNQGL
ncbi:hypothetical protein [Bacillus paralicheniformis]|uniref:hypothetical protein n=1 Tax=Bacillus paralicheniformis TaxID=1648923 RepID=UPI00208E947F|nr:hypothetical protein [Bacillus paralicheniformis]